MKKTKSMKKQERHAEYERRMQKTHYPFGDVPRVNVPASLEKGSTLKLAPPPHRSRRAKRKQKRFESGLLPGGLCSPK